jgi:nucleoside 2-deoxyribosyltransferase
MLNVNGHLLYEQMVGQRATGSQVFVAMWFNDEMADAYRDGIEPAVRETGYEPLRIDRSHHINKIDDQIIAEIRRSAIVVADFTGHRGGVYYEAGFAHGLGKQVIFTCRQDMLADLHFDVRQYNTIVWRDATQLGVELRNRLLAVFGAGPLRPDAKPASA